MAVFNSDVTRNWAQLPLIGIEITDEGSSLRKVATYSWYDAGSIPCGILYISVTCHIQTDCGSHWAIYQVIMSGTLPLC
jgi:hypothetical protein